MTFVDIVWDFWAYQWVFDVNCYDVFPPPDPKSSNCYKFEIVCDEEKLTSENLSFNERFSREIISMSFSLTFNSRARFFHLSSKFSRKNSLIKSKLIDELSCWWSILLFFLLVMTMSILFNSLRLWIANQQNESVSQSFDRIFSHLQ